VQIAAHNNTAESYREQKIMMAERMIKRSEEQLITTTLQLADMTTKQGHADTAAKLKAITFKSFPDPRLKP
jgi:hypothetical protein